jgi:hypothetical protein
MLQILHFRFKLGLKVVERGLDILDRKGSTIINYTWPGSDVELPYGTLEYMKVGIDMLVPTSSHMFLFLG